VSKTERTVFRTQTIIAIAAMGVIASIWFFSLRDGQDDAVSFRTASVERGPIVSTVSTSGTLNAVVTVQVGSQVSGQIMELLADYNSEVKAGEVIARIDAETFEAKLRQAQAEQEVARANVHIQRAGIERAQKELANAVSTLNSAKARTEKARVTPRQCETQPGAPPRAFSKRCRLREPDRRCPTTHDQALAQLKSEEADGRASESQVAVREPLSKPPGLRWIMRSNRCARKTPP